MTKQFLRAELGELHSKLLERIHRQSVITIGTIVAATTAVTGFARFI